MNIIQATNIEYDEHKGRIAIGRLHAGTLRRGMDVRVCFTWNSGPLSHQIRQERKNKESFPWIMYLTNVMFFAIVAFFFHFSLTVPCFFLVQLPISFRLLVSVYVLITTANIQTYWF